jgi:putative thioredoxin
MAEYDSLVASLNTPYVVEYTADWCGPCRALDPILQKAEKDFNGKWTLIKVDIDQPNLYSLAKTVVKVPLLAFYRGPEKVFEKAGLIAEGTFRQYVSQYLV